MLEMYGCTVTSSLLFLDKDFSYYFGRVNYFDFSFLNELTLSISWSYFGDLHFFHSLKDQSRYHSTSDHIVSN